MTHTSFPWPTSARQRLNILLVTIVSLHLDMVLTITDMMVTFATTRFHRIVHRHHPCCNIDLYWRKSRTLVHHLESTSVSKNFHKRAPSAARRHLPCQFTIHLMDHIEVRRSRKIIRWLMSMVVTVTTWLTKAMSVHLHILSSGCQGSVISLPISMASLQEDDSNNNLLILARLLCWFLLPLLPCLLRLDQAHQLDIDRPHRRPIHDPSIPKGMPGEIWRPPTWRQRLS